MSREKKVKLFRLPSDEPVINHKIISILHNLNLTITEYNDDVTLSIIIKKKQLRRVVKYLAELYVAVNTTRHENENFKATENELAEAYDDPNPVFWIDDERYLTALEVEVMERLALGRYNKWIADDLHLKECTIANNFQRIFRKFHVSNRTEALVEYQKCKRRNKQVS